MKILMINVVCGIRSTGRICVEQAQELEKAGHEVKIAYGRNEVPEEFRKFAVRIGSNRDVFFHALRSRLLDQSGFGSKRATRRFIKWVKEYDPDEIHLHNLHGYYINVEILFAYLKTCGKKIVWTLHDCWCFTGHCTHYMIPRCNKWKTGCEGVCPQKKAYPKCWLRSAAGVNYAKKRKLFTGISGLELITPSAWLAEEVKKSFMCDYPVSVRHNEIDHSVFRPIKSCFREKYGLTDRQIILGVANTWTDSKGWSDYLKMAKQLNDNQCIVLVGVTRKQKKQLPPGIVGIEKTDSKEALAKIYSAADYFVNLTYEDNYPSVNLEAIACGTRVITYDTGGCAETVAGYGSVVPTGDLEQVVRIIRTGQTAGDNV